MKTRIANLTLAVLFALGALGVAAPSHATSWSEAIGISEKETGTEVAKGYSTDWARAVSSKGNVVGTRVASAKSIGFLELARSN